MTSSSINALFAGLIIRRRWNTGIRLTVSVCCILTIEIYNGLVLACSRFSIGSSERKQRRAKKESERESGPQTPLIFFSLARRSPTAPLTEGLEQAISVQFWK